MPTTRPRLDFAVAQPPGVVFNGARRSAGGRATVLAAVIALSAAVIGQPAQAQAASPRPRVEKAADLPRFSYPLQGSLEALVRSADAFAPLSGQLRRDIESVLAGHEIADKAAQRDLLSQLAVLDFLEGRYDEAIARTERVRALEEKPADKLLSGLRLRAMASAAKAYGTGTPAYGQAVADAIAQELAAMPYAVIANDIKSAKARAEFIGESLVLGQVREVLQPMVVSNGALSSEFTPGLVNARFGLTAVLPLKDTLVQTYSSYLASHQVAKADIRAARDISLPARGHYSPVAVAVWDSGVETSQFPRQLQRDGRGRPALLAFDKYGMPSTSELQPIPPALVPKLPELAARTQGFSDLQANIDSPQAGEVKRQLSTMAPAEYKTVIEEIGLAGNYQHGTHVAGITLAGNPHARLVVGRIEFGHTLQPDPCPSLELVRREAVNQQAMVDFFKRQRVRVVNMSWGGDVKSIEDDLEKCGTVKDAAALKALARQIFDIEKAALTRAYASAPGILFVAAAGNSNSDASFTESMPADIVLPNLLTVGAVDLAGDEASFTSYGPTVKLHANGHQVESNLPGGSRARMSGTSMAAPQVANLATKLLAVAPRLSPQALIRVMVETADRSEDGRRVLVNPRKALARVKQAKA